MPIYDYACGACGKVLEVVHGIHADGPRFCPSCGAEGRMTKVVGAPAVVFKGSGWAKKDRSTTAAAGRSGTAAKDDSAPKSPEASPDERSGGAERGSATSTEKAPAKATSAAASSGDD